MAWRGVAAVWQRRGSGVALAWQLRGSGVVVAHMSIGARLPTALSPPLMDHGWIERDVTVAVWPVLLVPHAQRVTNLVHHRA